MNKNQIKLKTAAEEIKEILRKHDIAGSFALHAPGHGEFINHFNTSYSCVYHYEDDKVRLYAKREDFASDEEMEAKLRDTSNMLRVLLDLLGHNFLALEPLSKIIDEKVGAEHSGGSFKP